MRKALPCALRALCCAVMLALLFSLPCAAGAEETDVLADALPILVNKDYPVSEDFVPADLVLLTDVLDSSIVNVKSKDCKAVRGAAEALETMLEGARDDGVKNWQINTAYRSIPDQQKLLDNKVRRYMKDNGLSRSKARARALRTVAGNEAVQMAPCPLLGLRFHRPLPGG